MGRDEKEHPLDTRIVTDRILFERRDRNQETTGYDLIKLVYLCHSWHLGIYGAPLIKEKVEAWAHGPIIPSVYHRFMPFIDIPILIESHWIDPKLVVGQLTDRQESLIDSVLDTYNDLDSWSLGAIANKPGSPWDQVRRVHGILHFIPNELIQQHYGKLYRKHNAKREGVGT